MFPLSFAQSTPDWPMFHYDPAHTGYSTSSSSSNAKATTSGIFLWNYTTESWVYSSPAVADGVVYVSSGDQMVYALNATTGDLIWKYLTGYEIYSSPAVAIGVVYVSSGDGLVYALNANTGDLIWKWNTGSRVDSYSSPAVVNGVVYVGSLNKIVYALNANTGALIWKYTTGGGVYSSPAIVNGVVYIGSLDNNVYALNATTGAFIWKYTTGSQVTTSSPSVIDGVVYIGSLDNNVYALNATTGDLIWDFTTGYYVEGSPAVANGMIYVGSYDGKFYALDAKSGMPVWSYTTSTPNGDSAVANGVVYFGSFDGFGYALNANTGDLIWKKILGRSIESSCPAVANGVVYVGSDIGKVYAISAAASTLGFFNGFEDGFNSWTSTYGGVSVVTSPVYSGSKAMLCSNPYSSQAYVSGFQQSTMFAQAKFMLTKNMVGMETLIAFFDSNDVPAATLMINVVGGGVYLGVMTLLPSYSYAQYDVTDSLSANTWFSAALESSSSGCTIYFNDAAVQSISKQDFPSIGAVSVGMFWGTGDYQGTLVVEDVGIG
jgi:outer membrane protein assembly factor BamB